MDNVIRIVISVIIFGSHYPFMSVCEESKNLPVEHRMGPMADIGQPIQANGDNMWPETRADMPQIRNLNVLCEKNHMKVAIEFDRPFFGMIFSKGHYNDPACVYLKPGSSFVTANFEVLMNQCGARSNAGGPDERPGNSFIENTVIIQYDPAVQEVWDQARKLRCTWYDFYEKSVTFKPYNVDTLQAVQANFLGDNVQCWMQIQAGKGPWANEVDGIVKIGQTMTMVLAIKDDENKFDMLVRNCVAHDGQRPPIQLVDDFGCVIRPKVMSPFHKIQNFGASASVVSYAYFQAFKFPDAMNVFFQCVIQVCRHQCPEPVCGNGHRADDGGLGGDPRVMAVASGIKEQIVLKPNLQQHSVTVNRPVRIQNGPQHAYLSVGRDGNTVNNVSKMGVNNFNGRPRAANLNNTTKPQKQQRQRRANDDGQLSSELSVSTNTRMIKVVAPGDVAFSLGGANETVVVAQSAYDFDLKSFVCLTMPSFVAGLAILLLITTVACLVASFLFLRLRTFYASPVKSVPEVESIPQLSITNLEMVKTINEKA